MQEGLSAAPPPPPPNPDIRPRAEVAFHPALKLGSPCLKGPKNHLDFFQVKLQTKMKLGFLVLNGVALLSKRECCVQGCPAEQAGGRCKDGR